MFGWCDRLTKSRQMKPQFVWGFIVVAVAGVSGCTPAASSELVTLGPPVESTAAPLESTLTSLDHSPVPTEAAPTTSVLSTFVEPLPADETQVLAGCVDGDLQYQIPGRRDEVALYQQTLRNLGYYHAEVDGLFGPATLNAAMAEIRDNGHIVDANGEFRDVNTDDATILLPTFERLTIAC